MQRVSGEEGEGGDSRQEEEEYSCTRCTVWAAQQQAGVDAARGSARQPVPEPMESWEVANVVGKSKAGKMKKAFWKTNAGQLAVGELKPELLSSAEITCEASGAIYNARVGMQAPNGFIT